MKIKIISLAVLFMLAAILFQPMAQAQQVTDRSHALALTNSSMTSATTNATPPSCVASLLADYVNWLKQSANHIVRATTASNQKNRLVSYGDGTLTITSSPFPAAQGQPMPTGPYTLEGTLKQYFSDRKYGLPPSGGGVVIDQYPFSPTKTDQLGLSISTTGQVTLTLKSYSNKTINLTGVDCAGGVLYGLTNTFPNQSFYVISFSKDSQETPQIK